MLGSASDQTDTLHNHLGGSEIKVREYILFLEVKMVEIKYYEHEWLGIGVAGGSQNKRWRRESRSKGEEGVSTSSPGNSLERCWLTSPP